ncbi:8067_t:CDS:2, partial [Funneliformis mosseae]
FDLEIENNIVEAAKGLSGTSLANIKLEYNNNFLVKVEYSGYICPNILEYTIPQLILIISIDNDNKIEGINKYEESTKEIGIVEELEKEDIPKVHTIQNWISSYTYAFKQKAIEYELKTEL